MIVITCISVDCIIIYCIVFNDCNVKVNLVIKVIHSFIHSFILEHNKQGGNVLFIKKMKNSENLCTKPMESSPT